MTPGTIYNITYILSITKSICIFRPHVNFFNGFQVIYIYNIAYNFSHSMLDPPNLIFKKWLTNSKLKKKQLIQTVQIETQAYHILEIFTILFNHLWETRWTRQKRERRRNRKKPSKSPNFFKLRRLKIEIIITLLMFTSLKSFLLR